MMPRRQSALKTMLFIAEKLYRRDFQLSSLLRYIKEAEAEKLHGYEGGDVDLILRMLHDPTTVKDTANRTGNMTTAAKGHHRPRPHAPAAAAAAADQDTSPRPGSWPSQAAAAAAVNGLHLVEQGENDLLHEVAHGLHFASIALLGFLVVEVSEPRRLLRHRVTVNAMTVTSRPKLIFKMTSRLYF